MTRLLLAVLGITLSGVAFGSCKSDVGGTFKTSQPELRPYGSIDCVGCREINHHPEDIRNFMYNWALLGRASTLYPDLRGLGRYIVGFRMSNRVVLTPLLGGPGSNVLSVPICNDHGQCATATLEIEFNLFGIRNIGGLTLGWITGVKEHHIKVTLPNGDVRGGASYSPNMQTKHLERPGSRLPLPADKKPDFAKDGDCLNNMGEKRPPDSEMRPTSSADDGDDPYGRWWDEEEAYGGRVPTHRCGIVSISGGDSTRTCGWFWY